MRNRLFIIIAILIQLYVSNECHAQDFSPVKIISSTGSVFQSLGDLPGGDFESSAQAVSADGTIIAGTAKTENGSQAFFWTEESGMISLGNLADNSFNESWAYGLSGDGKTIIGAGDVGSGWNTHKGFVWAEENGMTLIGSLDGSERYEAFAVSSDGYVIVGDGGQQIFRWIEETGCVGLGTLEGRNASRGVDVSDDGSVIVGSSYNLPDWDSEQAYRWTKEDGIVGLGFLPNSKYSFAIAVSNDGKVIVGTGYASGGYPAFRWTEKSGMVNIGHLPGKTTTHPQDLTADGSIIVGGSFQNRGASPAAFIWDETNGMRSLQDVLQNDYGLDLTGWTLAVANGITPDGKVIVGWGINPDGKQEAFRVELGVSKSYLGQTPPGTIHDAAAVGDLNKVKALLKVDLSLLEAKDDRLSYKGNTPLISACWGHPSNVPQAEVANFLIDKGANINAKNDRGATPFYFAVKNIELAKSLLGKGTDINVDAYGGYTPLMRAAYSGNLEAAKFLIANGAELNTRSQRGTILHYLIADNLRISDKGEKTSDTAMVKLLVESGANLEEFSFGNTELQLAVLQGSTDMVHTLIDLGVDVNIKNDYGHTAIYYAAMHGYKSKADLLIAVGADKNTLSESNYSKATQLNDRLENGEAYLWYLGGNTSPYTGYAVKTKEHLIIFNPSDINESSEAGLANGYLNPNELSGQNITTFITFKNYLGRIGSDVDELSRKLPGTNFVLNFKPDTDDKNIQYKLAAPNESFSLSDVKVHTIPAMRKAWFGDEGLGYLVEADGLKIFYPGLHAPENNEDSEIRKYRKEIDFLKSFAPVDIVILPISGRHIYFEYAPYLYLIDQLSPKAIYLIGDDLANEEHLKCIDVLKTFNVPVYYPEGGIAVGQRFHYTQD